jgi:predicted nucleic acid-binding protein
MPSVVVDASALVDLFIGRPGAGSIFERLFRGRVQLHAPHSIDGEVLSAIFKLWRRRLLTDQHVDEIVDIYGGLTIERHLTTHLLDRIWRLRHNVSPYDAAYVALAESLNLPLLTRDARLSRSSGHTATIEYIA